MRILEQIRRFCAHNRDHRTIRRLLKEVLMDFTKLDAAVAALKVSDVAIEAKVDLLLANQANPADQAHVDAAAADVQVVADAQAAKAA